ncbi:TATA box-binding protein-associated factor RNA polymerase I subunit B, partial [Linum perenne]
QCEALVEEFGVSPLIVRVVSSVWLRFVAVSGVFRDEWANDTVLESESQKFVGKSIICFVLLLISISNWKN